MRMDEALRGLLADPEKWARPKSWKGQGTAYALGNKGLNTVFVLGNNWGKGHASMTSLVSELIEEWELVTREDVEAGL